MIHLAAGYSGKVWLEDTHTDIRIHGKQTVRAVHYNPENNHWTEGRTYVGLAEKVRGQQEKDN